jgi:hypothetical protein
MNPHQRPTIWRSVALVGWTTAPVLLRLAVPGIPADGPVPFAGAFAYGLVATMLLWGLALRRRDAWDRQREEERVVAFNRATAIAWSRALFQVKVTQEVKK